MKLVPPKINKTAVEYVENLLEKTKSGEVIGVTVVQENSDGTYSSGGSSVSSRTACAGMFLDAAITRLGQP
jgi:hypothetical protein